MNKLDAHSTTPFIRYGRISELGDRAAGDNTSIRLQDSDTIDIAKRHKLATFPDMVTDEDVSGATFSRPGWEDAIGRVKRKEAAGIIAFDLKRMSRGKTAEVLAMIDDVEAVGGQLYDGSGRLSVADADSEMMVTMKAMVGRREWRERRDGRMASVRDAIQRGVHLGIAFGYKRSNGKGTPLAPNATEAPTVVRAYELRAKGYGWVAVATELNDAGMLPRAKSDGTQTRWTHKTVRALIQSEVYLGVAFNGPHRNEHAHKALVPRKLWNAANKAQGTRHAGPSEGYLLTGLVRCASCGYAMVHSPQKGRGYYVCKPSTHAHAACAAPTSVPAEALEAYMDERFVEELAAIRKLEAVPNDEGVVRAEALVIEVEAKLAQAFDATFNMGKLSKTEARIVEQRLDAVRDELNAAQENLERERTAARGFDLPSGLVGKTYETLSVERRRHLLSLVFAGVAVRKAATWREDIDKRVLVVTRDEMGAGDVIPFFASLDW